MKTTCSRVKRVVAACFVVVLTMTACISPAMAKVGQSYTSRVGGLRMHKGPSGKSEIIGKLSKGQKVVHQSTSKGWWKIKTADGNEGYVFRTYLKAVEQKIKKDAYYKVYKISSLTVRKGPRAAAEKLGAIKRGTVVQLTAKQGDWGYIKTAGGSKGWVQIKYLNYLRG